MFACTCLHTKRGYRCLHNVELDLLFLPTFDWWEDHTYTLFKSGSAEELQYGMINPGAVVGKYIIVTLPLYIHRSH